MLQFHKIFTLANKASESASWNQTKIQPDSPVPILQSLLNVSKTQNISILWLENTVIDYKAPVIWKNLKNQANVVDGKFFDSDMSPSIRIFYQQTISLAVIFFLADLRSKSWKV